MAVPVLESQTEKYPRVMQLSIFPLPPWAFDPFLAGKAWDGGSEGKTKLTSTAPEHCMTMVHVTQRKKCALFFLSAVYPLLDTLVLV